MSMVLHSYWRSSCSWRVRISFTTRVSTSRPSRFTWSQTADISTQKPTARSTQCARCRCSSSMAPQSPRAWPSLSTLRSATLPPHALPQAPEAAPCGGKMAELINSGIQPIQNLRVMQRLGREFDLDKAAQRAWSRG